MIRIDVEEYCHTCLDFSPDVTTAKRKYSDDDEMTMGDTIVRCEHKRRCAGIRRHLEQCMKGEKNV